MSNPFNPGTIIGGIIGTGIAGPAGTFVGGALGGLVGDAYSKKPVAGSFATTLQNDLAPENVTLDAHQIYMRITNGHGVGSLLDANDAATALTSSFVERANQIAAARSAAAAVWQGDASAAADAATAPLSDSFAVAQAQLAANSQALNAEATAFEHIRSQVEFVPETPPQSNLANSMNPFQTDVDAAINEYNAKAAKNVQLYEAYSAETAAARSQVAQSYAEPAPLSASATGITHTASPIGAAPAAPPQVSPAAEAGQLAATNASAAPGAAASAPPSTGGAPDTPSGTAGQGASATDQTARQAPSTTVPAATTPTARDSYASTPFTGQPRPTGMYDMQRKPTGAGPGIGGFGGGAGPRGTGGSTGTGGGTATGGGPGVRGGGSVGNGPVPGPIPPGEGQQAGRGGPGARGAAGMGGTPMAPAGRSNGEEDQEHRKKYLVQPDSEELFGSDEPYIRPVIGDNR